LEEVIEVMRMTDDLYKKVSPDFETVKKAKERMIQHFGEVNKNYPHLEY